MNGIVEEGIALRRQQNADDGVILARRQRLARRIRLVAELLRHLLDHRRRLRIDPAAAIQGAVYRPARDTAEFCYLFHGNHVFSSNNSLSLL